MLVSLFGINETNPNTEVEESDQPIEVGADTKSEVKTGNHPIEESEVNPNKKVPLPLQGFTELSLEIEPTLEVEKMQLGSDNAPVEAFD